MRVHYKAEDVLVIHGDCRDVLPKIELVDAVVTDPPYGLTFMGQGWDHGVPGKEFWELAFKAMKPGAHLLAFGGTRTYHRLTCAIEDAGFEIRDCIMWVYGTGFPKSLDVGKAIDKAGGASPRDQAAILRRRREASGLTRDEVAAEVGCTPASVRDWEEGRARERGGAIEQITPSVEYRTKLAGLLGYSADERREVGASSDRRGDGSTYGLGHSGVLTEGGNTEAARQWDGWGTALKPAWEPIIVARRPLEGRVVDNVLAHGTGGINVDACRVGTTKEVPASVSKSQADGIYGDYAGGEVVGVGGHDPNIGRWPANVVHDGGEEVMAAFPAAPGQQGDLKATGRDRPGKGVLGKMGPPPAHAARRDGVARKPRKGTVAANVLKHGTGGLNIDACRVGHASPDDLATSQAKNPGRKDSVTSEVYGANRPQQSVNAQGRWPANVAHDGSEEVLGLFPETKSGATGPHHKRKASRNMAMGGTNREDRVKRDFGGDAGSAARFFYTAKASRKERGEDNKHPTVKPMALMRWLVRLVTPPGGLVLDPFVGSGTTLLAAKVEGMRSVGIEAEEGYCEIAAARLKAQEREREGEG